jgi:hypothetical protein
MLRKLILSACLFAAANSFAQVGITPIKTTENNTDPQIDYKLVGAPMPPLIAALMHDTACNASKSAVTGSTGEPRRRRKKKDLEATSAHPSGYITDKDLDNGANLFVMMFNPTCSHCQNATQMLGKNISLFSRSKIVLLAKREMQPFIGDFIKNNNTDSYYPTMYVGIDSSKFIDNVFLYQMLPQINIYNNERRLVKIFTGDVSIDSLQKYVQ